ncbi:hypothetical protein, partial [uncultured Duncaniella sp.]
TDGTSDCRADGNKKAKKQRAVIATALLFFNLKSNTMKTQCKYSNYVFITSGSLKSSRKQPI